MLSGVSGIFDICEGNKPISLHVRKSTTNSKTIYIPVPLQCRLLLSVDIQKLEKDQFS